MFKFEIGEILKDKITGFTGVLLARTQYYTGCSRYGLSARKLNDKGELPELQWIDETLLKSTGKRINITKEEKQEIRKGPGGPDKNAPSF